MSRRKIFLLLLTPILFALGIKKVFDYTLPPFKEKECNFVFPSLTDSTKSTTLTISYPDSLPFSQKGGFVNDASCLNKTSVYGVVKIHRVEDIQHALQFAKQNNLSISPAGATHSMGGQSFVRGGLVLDMKEFKSMSINEEQKILTVDSGATWSQVQQFLDPYGLSLKAMQSINIFTVGGTLSVNAHGISHNPGQIASTVKSLRVLTPDGEIKTASRTENTELFSHVLGGYGLFGIILDAQLELTDNEMYQWKTQYVDYRDFSEFYTKNIEGRPEYGLMYARLSVSPLSYLEETSVHTFQKMPYAEKIPELVPNVHTNVQRFVINFSKTGGFGRWLRWTLEKAVYPKKASCVMSRNQAMSQPGECLVARNQMMFDSMWYLKNRLPDTDILQEYFIPQDRFAPFVEGLRGIVQKNDANLLNATIRIVHKDMVTALPYAPEDMFAVVLYFNQDFSREKSEQLQKTTQELIDLSIQLGGTFYLPYQLYYTPEQLHQAYPGVDNFFQAKKQQDPEGILTNTWYEKYGK